MVAVAYKNSLWNWMHWWFYVHWTLFKKQKNKFGKKPLDNIELGFAALACYTHI